MKHLFLSFVILACVSCESPNKVIMTSIRDSWEAMKPYAVAGINTAPELKDAPDAKVELIEEADELSKTIAHEVEHGK
jgi:hypothetical protein